METKTRILILEHDQNDLELLQYQLKKSDLDYTTVIVQTKDEFEEALSCFNPDIILSDYSLPSFDGLSAFKIKQKVSPETPFIIVSGTLGEEKAVELIKMGVTDYALKDRMYQILPKIKRALNESADRKQKDLAQIQLRKREEHLQKIMDLSLDVIWSLDQEGRFVSLNTASKLILDYLPEELIGRKLIDIVHEEDKERTRLAIANLSQEIDLFNFENRFIRKSGASITLLWSARWDHRDKLAYSVAKDITYIKKAEEKIKNNERRFRTLLQNSYDGLALLTSDGTIIERSPSAVKILELDESETSGKFRTDLVHPEDLSIILKACDKVKEDPNLILTVEFRMRRRSGNFKWVELTLHNQLNESEVGAIVLNFRDITEKKEADLAIQKSEAKYRNLFNLSPSPMWLFDVETMSFLDVNEAALQHYGYTKEEFLTLTLKDIRPEEELTKLMDTDRTHKYSSTLYIGVTKHLKKNGEVIDVEIRNNLIEVGDKKIRLVLASDISDRMKYIHAIEEQNIKLREIAWTQSHIVRAPVARIMGLASLPITCSSEKVDSRKIFNYILNSANELDGIIREIVRKTEKVKDDPIFEM